MRNSFSTDLSIRVTGMLAAFLGLYLGIILNRVKTATAPSEPSGSEWLLAIASVVLLFAGAILLCCGGALFRSRRPPR